MLETAQFLKSQMDYIFFVYGLAFMVLGVVCFTRQRSPQEVLPWLFMGLFGFAHGLNEWLDLFALTAGDTPLFYSMRLVVMAASFAFLVEFGRVATIKLDMRSVGRWIVPFLLLVALLIGSLLGGQGGLNGGFRYALGLVGCLWAAYVLFAKAATLEGLRRRWLISAGIAMALYGMAAGAVVPAASSFPASFLNQDTFFAAIGAPIQLFRAFFACWIMLAVWAYEQSRFEESHLMTKRRWYFRATVAVLIMTIGLGWILTNNLGRLYQEDLRRDLAANTSLLVHRLSVDTTITQGLAKAMSTSNELAGLASTSPDTLSQINLLVDRYSAVHPGLIAYVMDRDGTVIAASNRPLPNSLVGQNYRFRPYFQDALAERFGQFFAIGVTTGEAGFYASAPIRNGRQEIVGVAVVKHTLDAESLGLTYFQDAFLVDANGVVLLSGMKSAPYSLWPLPPDQLREIRASQQFAGKEVTSLAQQRFENGEWISIAGKKFLVGRQLIGPEGWSIVLLKQEKSSLVNRLFGIILTLMASVLILVSLLVLQREFGTEILLHQNQRRLEALSRELELQATTDTLTGALNRLKFNDILSQEIKRARRYHTPLSLIMYDIDHFKRVNDTYGHQAGDSVLVQLTSLVADHVRESDSLARWGGEEFMIVVPHLNGSEAARLAEKLRELVEATGFAGVGRLSCSFGVAQFDPDDTADTLTGRADQALYLAKAGGRNRVVIA
ncbi:MAG TPA: diguanylate cyclase [Gallionella sp.]|nr:diguanylate cyclase [Gallionella sp.]